MTTNLNVHPYYDDFDASKKFVKILFKPGYAVQARELTQLQTGIQTQIERFGDHVFQHGSMVVPGNSTTDSTVYFAKLALTNISITAFTIGKEIVGATNGVKAIVKYVIAAEGTDPPTIYFNYTSHFGGITALSAPSLLYTILGIMLFVNRYLFFSICTIFLFLAASLKSLL